MREHRLIENLVKLLSGLAVIAGCGASHDPEGAEPLQGDEGPMYSELGSLEQGLAAACGGDDSNALTAALAVAIAKELGRWDANTDFTIQNGKLELSATGKLHCGSDCTNITALLRLQDDASGVITNHSPYTYRSKLTSWYRDQQQHLDGLVTRMLNVDKGVYRIRAQASGKYLVPQSGSTWSGAPIQQSDRYNWSTASQWRVVLNGTMHQLKNIRSGLCLDLTTNSNNYQNLVQRPCSADSFSQGFRFAQVDFDVYALRTSHQQSTAVANASTWNNAAIVQMPFSGQAGNQRFVFERVGGGHRNLVEVATAVYQLKVQHTGMAIGVANAALSDGVPVVQQQYSATDDRFHWYVNAVDSTPRYQFINRRTGSCLDLASDSPNSKLVQRRCSTAESQRFFFTPTGDGGHVIYSSHGVTVDVPGGSTNSGTQLGQGGKTWAKHNHMTFTPLTAGEPHRLVFSHEEAGGPCGAYYWFDVAQPNGMPLESPADTYVQLIFAGGKTSLWGADVNPFIAQKVSGDKVAIDPTYGLNERSSTTTGACTASCLKVSTASVAGQCCSCNGRRLKLQKSPWSGVTYICK